MAGSLRMQQVQSPIIPIVGEWIRQCPGTISLGQGVVHYGPPPQAIEKIDAFLGNPQNHKYHPVQGIEPLLEAIRRKLESENGIFPDPNEGGNSGERRICVAAGANMAFVNAVLAITDPGDEIVLLTPYYFNQEMAVCIADCRPILVPTDENYQPVPDAIRDAITDRTRAVVTISPNNPTGAVYPEASLREINRICREHGVYHIHDEAYEYFVYDSPDRNVRHFSPGSIEGSAPYTISLFSLSKSYGFASWRIGYMVYPADLEVSIKKIQDTILICPPLISQYAALGALQVGSSHCRERLPGFVEVREVMLNELDRIRGICTVPPADGAFYFLLKIATGFAAMELAERLVREHGVAVIPGETFGIEKGCYLRVSYGPLQKETAAEGIGRLVGGLKKILGA